MKMKSLFASLALLASTLAGWAQTNVTLQTAWKIVPGERPYVSNDGSSGLDRCIAYSAVSNQVFIVHRSAATTGLTINVLDATTGAFLYEMNKTGISGGSVILSMICVAEDGAVYAGNIHTTGSGLATFQLYRWADSGPTTAPVQIYIGEPASSPTTGRWGDSMDVRGSGTNTQVLVDNNQGVYGAVFTPIDASNLNAPGGWISTAFARALGSGSIGRSLQFGPGNSIWQKRKAARLELSSIDLDPNSGTYRTSTVLTNYTSLSTNIAGVSIAASQHLLAAINFTNVTTLPDALELYDVTDFNAPVLLSRLNFPTNHLANTAFSGQTVIYSNLVFSIDVNNGVLAARIVPPNAPLQPPVITTQPTPALTRLPVGSQISFQTGTDIAASYQWRRNGSNLPGATNTSVTLSNLQLSDTGSYTVAAWNAAGTNVSTAAQVIVEDLFNYRQLAPVWNLAPGAVPYLTNDNSTGLERSIAYDPLSNHLYLVHRADATNGLTINVLDADTGAFLSNLNTNGIGGGSIILITICVGEDGAIYAANMSTSGSGVAIYRLYRWADAAPDTVPVQIYSGEPANQSSSLRWGDTMAVRGSGTNTQILIDNSQGTFGAIITPTSADNLNVTGGWASTSFTRAYGTGSTGRSVQFGSGNTMWQKRKAARLELSSFDIDPASPTYQTSTVVTNYANLPASLSGVAVDLSQNLMAGISFAANTNTPDTLNIYDVSNFNAPLLVSSQNFPVNQQTNGAFTGQTIIAGDRIYSIDVNNGLLAFRLSPLLKINRGATTVQLSWSTNVGSFTLQQTDSLNPINWTTVSQSPVVSGNVNTVTINQAQAGKFFRLIK